MNNTDILTAATGISKMPQTFKSTIQTILIKKKASLMALMPTHVNCEAFLRTALTLASKKEFEDCCPITFLTSYATAAQLGLQPNSPLGHCYLLPFLNKGIRQVQLMLGYKGMLDIARRSNQLKSISAHVVYKDDEFYISLGLNPTITHTPNLNGTREDDQIIMVYAVAHLNNDGVQFEYLTIKDVLRAQRSAKNASGEYSPWRTDFAEMCKKTAIRKLFKCLPVSLEVAGILNKDEKADTLSAGIDYIENEEVIDQIEEAIKLNL